LESGHGAPAFFGTNDVYLLSNWDGIQACCRAHAGGGRKGAHMSGGGKGKMFTNGSDFGKGKGFGKAHGKGSGAGPSGGSGYGKGKGAPKGYSEAYQQPWPREGKGRKGKHMPHPSKGEWGQLQPPAFVAEKPNHYVLAIVDRVEFVTGKPKEGEHFFTREKQVVFKIFDGDDVLGKHIFGASMKMCYGTRLANATTCLREIRGLSHVCDKIMCAPLLRTFLLGASDTSAFVAKTTGKGRKRPLPPSPFHSFPVDVDADSAAVSSSSKSEDVQCESKKRKIAGLNDIIEPDNNNANAVVGPFVQLECVQKCYNKLNQCFALYTQKAGSVSVVLEQMQLELKRLGSYRISYETLKSSEVGKLVKVIQLSAKESSLKTLCVEVTQKLMLNIQLEKQEKTEVKANASSKERPKTVAVVSTKQSAASAFASEKCSVSPAPEKAPKLSAPEKSAIGSVLAVKATTSNDTAYGNPDIGIVEGSSAPGSKLSKSTTNPAHAIDLKFLERGFVALDLLKVLKLNYNASQVFAICRCVSSVVGFSCGQTFSSSSSKMGGGAGKDHANKESAVSPVVLLQGPPGTGKTKTILGILSALLAIPQRCMLPHTLLSCPVQRIGLLY
jgi:hypothetical protein